MSLSDLTRESVLEAVAEFDRLERAAFLAKYRFGRARSYFLTVGGRQYDSKAIAGAAHGFIGAGFEPLKAEEFSGGDATVAAELRRLGFDVHADAVEPAIRNPTWTRDELILALDLYMTHRGKPPGQKSFEVIELSGTLNRLGRQLGRDAEGTYRNPNGVYMKMANFMRLDPTVIAAGRVGLQRGGKDEEAVWSEFTHDPGRLRLVAALIRSTVDLPASEQPPPYDQDEITEAEEGRILTRLHRTRERSRKLVEQRKHKAVAETGALKCEACGFDFAESYGDRGHGFIEVHHTRPLHTLDAASKTRLADLALVCANCHRMIHATRKWLSVENLRAFIIATSTGG